MSDAPPLARRAYVLDLKVQADTLKDLIDYLRSFETELYMGKITRGVSGGYSSGAIYGVDVDETITHDGWAEANQLYVDWLRESGQ